MALPSKRPHKQDPIPHELNEVEKSNTETPIALFSSSPTKDIPDDLMNLEEKVDLDEIREQRRLQQREKLLKKEREREHVRRTITSNTNLTADDLINHEWSTYAHLTDAVVEAKTWLTDNLKANGQTQEVAEARAERGQKYDRMFSLIEHLLTRYFMQSGTVASKDTPVAIAMVANEILGLGPIEPLWRDKNINEIMVNGPYRVRIENSHGRLIDVPGARFRDKEHLLEVCQQILTPINRTIDVANPLQDGSLSDGSRVNIVHNALAPKGPYVTIRRFPETAFSLRDLVEKFHSMNPEMAQLLGNFVGFGLSTVVIGGTGSGKTSMLNALSGCISPNERVLVVEDTPELKLHPDRDILYVQSRPEIQGRGKVTIRDLVKNALRMRPDRIIVGEVRDFAAYDMLQAMNTGHDGSMTTVHANDAMGGIERLVNILSEGDEGNDARQTLSLIASGVDLFVTIKRYEEDGSRRCSGIYEIPNKVSINQAGEVELVPIPLWEWVQTGNDENNKIIGHWEKKNDVSESMIRKHRLDHRRFRDIEEIYEESQQSNEL